MSYLSYISTTISNRCYSFENNAWASFPTMSSVRVYAAAAQLQDGRLLVTGGYDDFGRHQSSSEMLTEEGWERNKPSLPVTVYGHCMITLNSTTVMVIGGWQNGRISGNTLYYSLGGNSWSGGPALKYPRGFTSCGKIRSKEVGQEMNIIVAGGWNGTSQSSVEILNEGSNMWQTSPELPFGIQRPQMIEDRNGGVILIGGQSSSSIFLDTLYQLPNGNQDAVWIKMDQKMKTAGWLHLAIMVPDSIVDCN
jgi:N-acetylneuraminic acid mutarotase